MVDDKRPFRIRVIETRQYEFGVWERDEDAARAKGIKIWSEAPTVSQWEVDATEFEYEAAEIKYEPGALPRADQ